MDISESLSVPLSGRVTCLGKKTGSHKGRLPT